MCQIINYTGWKKGLSFIIFFLISVQNLCAQAPDCEQCEDLIDDPIAYAQCVDENCNDAIPIDQNIWILIMAGTGVAVYGLKKYSPLNVH